MSSHLAPRRKNLGRVTALACAALAAGCDCEEVVVSAQEQIGFENPYRGSIPTRFRSGDPVVEGSQFCPNVVSWFDDGQCVSIGAQPQEWFEPCWDRQTLFGPAQLDAAGCLVFTEPAAGREDVYWHLRPRSCELEIEVPEFGPDQLDFDVRAIDDLRASWVWEFEGRAETLGSPGPEAGFPGDWTDPLGAEIRVVAGAPFVLILGLYDPQTDEPVASNAGVTVPMVLEGAPGVEPFSGLAIVELQPDDRVRVDLEIAAGIAEGPTLVGVPVDDVADLELVAVYEPGPGGERPWGPPRGVRAVVRDGAGRLLRAPGTSWLIHGELGTDPEPMSPDDYLSLPIACTDETPEYRSLLITAEIGGVSDALELNWRDLSCESAPPDPFGPEFDLDFGCVCEAGTGGGRGGLLAFAVVLVVLGGTRRARG